MIHGLSVKILLSHPGSSLFFMYIFAHLLCANMTE